MQHPGLLTVCRPSEKSDRVKARELFDEIHEFCVANADEEVVRKYARYFRDEYDGFGVSHEMVEEKVAELLGRDGVTMKLVLRTAPLLLKTGKFEETSFAMHLLMGFSEQFTRDTFDELGKWFEIGITNWAHTDAFCALPIRNLLTREIITYKALAPWRNARNTYQRRAVPVAMVPLLKTADDYKPFFTFIEPLMMDPERKVQQGLGWFLREAWKRKKRETESFLLKWKDDAGRVIFQYATEKMTPAQKKRFRRKKK
jgi:3-methyladenine DNA glycosylase AlkD